MKDLLSDIDRYIIEANAMLERGEIGSLSGLDEKVMELCKRVEALPVDEGKQYAVNLNDVHHKLDALQQQMQTVKGKIEQEIGGLNKRKAATRAYRSNEG